MSETPAKPEPSEVEINQSNQTIKHTKPWLQRIGRAVFLYLIIPYLVLLILLGLFQRSLIFHPNRTSNLSAEKSQVSGVVIQDIQIPTRDHLSMNGWHFSPASQNPSVDHSAIINLEKDDWLVLFFPGNAGNRSSRLDLPQQLTQSKMHVMICDYRGYGDNPGSPSEESLYDDAEAFWNFVIKKKRAAPNHIIIYGESLGGSVATHLAAYASQKNTPPAGLVLSGTFSSMTETASKKFPYFPVRLLLLDRFESDKEIINVTCPIVQLHGTDDQIVPIEIGKKLFNAAPEKTALGIKKQFIEVNHAGHNNLPIGSIIEGIEKMRINGIAKIILEKMR